MAMVAPTAIITIVLANEVELSREKNKKDTKGAHVRVIGPYLLIVMFFSPLLNSRYSSPIWGSTFHKVLYEKHVQKHQNHREDQYPQTNNICNLNKTLAEPTCNIKTKINNTTFTANPNSRA
jgi:hypothetical protein